MLSTHEKISASNDTLLEQTPPVVNNYLDHAVSWIDQQFGAGFAQKNPALVAAYVHACSFQVGCIFIARAIETISTTIEPVVAQALTLDAER